MGVEYSHGLFVSDLTFQPTWAQFLAVHDVLVKWKLATKTGIVLYDLDDDVAPVTTKAAAKQLPLNMMAVYGDIDGQPAVDVMGDSAYDIDPKNRYIMTIQVVFGSDFKVLIDEVYDVEVKTPPKNGKIAVEQQDSMAIGNHWIYPATWTTTPPKTKVSGEFPGVWRVGIVFDCNKDVPAIAENTEPLPAKGFRKALEKALGTPLIEHGWYH
jgi:hypothetical protein